MKSGPPDCERERAKRFVESFGDDQYRLTTTVTEGGETIIDGEAIIKIQADPVQMES